MCMRMKDDKTEFILTGTCQQLDKVNDPKIHIGTNTFYPVTAVWNLGFHQDSELKNTTNINKLCSVLALTIKKICKAWKSLTKEAAQVQIQSSVLC